MEPLTTIPNIDELIGAVTIYIEEAYAESPNPDLQRKFTPDPQDDPRQWLMGPNVERDPADAGIDEVRSFALRLGNPFYPHMKLRVTRPPQGAGYVFSVDSHDMFLQAPPGSPDAAALEQLKQGNADLARKIVHRWQQAGIRTEHDHVRDMIRQIKRRRDGRGADPTEISGS